MLNQQGSDNDHRGRVAGNQQHGNCDPNQTRVLKKPIGEKARKAGSGGKRFDELLGGGFPFRSCTMLQGPAFVGKDVLLSQFIYEGIKFGTPAIVVLTDSSTTKFRKTLVEMDYKLEEHEKAGLLYYVDCHTKTVGMLGKNPFARYLEGINDLEAIIGAVETFQSGIREHFFYHRLIFDSLSSVLRSHGANRTIDFVNSLNVKVKNYNGIALFDLAGGIHRSEEVNSLEHSMDGSILLKEEKGKYYMTVKGLPDLKTTQWVEYSYKNQGLDIKGSYSYSYIQ